MLIVLWIEILNTIINNVRNNGPFTLDGNKAFLFVVMSQKLC